jgi:Protein of unknown function (DUF2568)
VDALKGVLLAVRFALELGAIAALAYWGFRDGDGAVLKVVLGIGAPAAAIALWGLFVSPKAKYGGPVSRAVFELIVFAAAVVALVAADRTGLAVVFAVIALADSVALRLLDAVN